MSILAQPDDYLMTEIMWTLGGAHHEISLLSLC